MERKRQIPQSRKAKQQQEKTKIIDHELISDIGSGLNYRRKGFQRLLERVHAGTIEEIVVTHKDRLCRYGVELLEWFFTKTGTKLMVHCRDYQEVDPSRELADDLLAVCNFFVARNNGRRASDNRKRRRRIEEEEQATRGQGQEDQVVSNEEAAGDPRHVVQDGQVDI